MKIKSLGVKNSDVYGSFQEAVISTLIGYGKMYELLHKQLYRKGRISYAGDPFILNNKEVRAIKLWNIKSPSKNAYDRTSYNNLGLNQFFMGQSPYDVYDGDLGDGIYHDDCYITYKETRMLTNCYDRYGWFIEEHGYWIKEDEWGKTIVSDVTIEENTYIVTTPEGSTQYPLNKIYFESGDDSYKAYPTLKYVNFSNHSNSSGIWLSQYFKIPDMETEHGKIIYFEEAYRRRKISPFGTRVASKICIYEDGLALEYFLPVAIVREGGDDSSTSYTHYNGGYFTLPLLYTSTGDLVQNRVDFLDMWDDQFELYVHEDDYWYTPIIKIVVLIILMIVAYFTGGSGLAIMAGFISGLGVISGDAVFSVIGTALSLGVSFYMNAKGAVAKEAMAKGLSERTANQLATEAGLSELFSAFISNVGLMNLADIGSSLFSIYTVATTKEITTDSTEIEEKKLRVYAYNEDEKYSDKVMDLIKL